MTTPLTSHQRKGLLKLGDVVIPGTADFPSFSKSGAAQHIGLMLPYMNASDRDSLLGLLSTCASLPKPAIRAIVALAANWAKAPEPVAGALRMANLGIKGVIHSLYYADLDNQGIRSGIGYDATIDVAAFEASLNCPTKETP